MYSMKAWAELHNFNSLAVRIRLDVTQVSAFHDLSTNRKINNHIKAIKHHPKGIALSID